MAKADTTLEVQEAKSLSVEDAKQKVSDIKVIGKDNLFAVASKASSEKQGWVKSTKVMNGPTGALVQVTTQQKNLDGTYSVAEALAFIPDTKFVNDGQGGLEPVAIN